MPSSNVRLHAPLVRLNPFMPGQFGVPGASTDTGLREHSTGTIIYVDPNHPDSHDGKDGTDAGSPMRTVAAALTKCRPYRGDEIWVMANNGWQYGDPTDGYVTIISEEVEITVPGVKLVGVSPFGSMGVYWTPASDGGTCITVSAIDVLIEGFCFTEGGVYAGCNAIYAEWDGATLFGENLTVRNCYFDDTVDIAIQLEYSWYCDIHRCVFESCDEFGIYVNPAGSGVAYLRVHHNEFRASNAMHAVDIQGADSSWVWQNSLFNGDAAIAAAALDEGIVTTGGRENMVYDNWLSCALPAAAPGDYDNFCTAAATDAWINNHCMDGDAVTNPA